MSIQFYRSYFFVGVSTLFMGALWWGKMGTTVEAGVDLSAFMTPTGNMVNLTEGQVHYKWYGPADGDLAVLVHGLTSNEGVMGWLAKDLANNGYRVLAYDLYGRGHSDNSKSEHTHELFTNQINELLEALGRGNDDFFLIGYSMGGAVSMIYTAQYSHRVKKLVLIAPAGLPLEFPLSGKIGNLPYIGELMTSNPLFKYFYTSTAKESFIAPHIESEFAEYIVGLTHFHVSKASFFSALLSTLRNFPLSNAVEFYEIVGKMKIPTLFAWGTHDQMCPYSMSEQALQLIPHAQLVTLENAGHAALLENSTVVNNHIIDFLNVDALCQLVSRNITYPASSTNNLNYLNLVDNLVDPISV